jgi:hypothetical protein
MARSHRGLFQRQFAGGERGAAAGWLQASKWTGHTRLPPPQLQLGAAAVYERERSKEGASERNILDSHRQVASTLEYCVGRDGALTKSTCTGKPSTSVAAPGKLRAGSSEMMAASSNQ